MCKQYAKRQLKDQLMSCSVFVLCILGMAGLSILYVDACSKRIMLVGNTVIVVHHFSLVPNLEEA